MTHDSRAAVVYRYYDAFDILIYVGITARGHRRAVEHAASKEWWPLVARQEIEHFDSSALAAEREVELIRRHTPPFNIQHNPNWRHIQNAYMRNRPTLEVPTDAPTSDLLAVVGRRWPVAVCDRKRTRCTIHLPLSLRQAAARTVWRKGVKILMNNVGVGQLTGEASSTPGGVWIPATLRQSVEATSGELAVKLDPNACAFIPRVIHLTPNVGDN